MTEEVQGNSENQNRSESPALKTPTDPESLAIAVRTQVEYYFSKDNLRTDAFLQANMDAQNAVPLATVMGFPKIMHLTRDTQLVIKSLESSNVVALVDGKIKPKGSGRSTIILREIPSDSSEESIREIFNYPGAKPISSIKSEIGDTWFVTMESEEDAKDTIMDLKLKKRTFNNVAVKARLKTDAGLRSYYTAPAVLPLAYPGMTFQPYGMVLESQPGYNYDSSTSSNTSPTSQNREKPAVSNRKETNEGTEVSETNNNTTTTTTSTTGSGSGSGSGRREGKDRSSNRNSKGRTDSSNRKNSSGKGSGRDKKDHSINTPPPPPIEINSAADFPPLPPQNHSNHSTDNDHATPINLNSNQQSEPGSIPPQGYVGHFIHYSIDEILQIVSGIKDATLPNTIKLADHSAALTTTPNTDLLLRQRTFSIDETREQMQLGRPVQREAVITGAVDIGSLIYGEDDHHGTGSSVTSATSSSAAAAVVVTTTPNIPQEHTSEKKSSTKNSGGSWAGVLMKGGAPAPQTDVKPNSTPVKASQTSSEKPPAASTPAPASTPSGSKSEKKGSNEKKKNSKSQQDGNKKEGGAKQEGEATTNTNNNNNGGGKKSRNRRRAGSQGEAGAKDAKAPEEGGDKTAVPSSWGGRPTFANVLKQQEEAAAAAAAASGTQGTTTPSTTPTPSTNATTSAPKSQQKSQNNQNKHHEKKYHDNKGHNKSNHQHSKKPMTNPDGTW
eukprot:CAMPEP_0174821964 /NCGR_PEP_ID=MMETSP1107-20130205/11757_1 /TAXON_ID=36770 /ORGANISM="Paraphysomonas vestita, Strain GFlagA" /LENGTH=724 /DNA_ID=CAMNT_0016039671 /DNA_START=13 /DNA_END=2184 /DNA_ORIENTATION=-